MNIKYLFLFVFLIQIQVNKSLFAQTTVTPKYVNQWFDNHIENLNNIQTEILTEDTVLQKYSVFNDIESHAAKMILREHSEMLSEADRQAKGKLMMFYQLKQIFKVPECSTNGRSNNEDISEELSKALTSVFLNELLDMYVGALATTESLMEHPLNEEIDNRRKNLCKQNSPTTEALYRCNPAIAGVEPDSDEFESVTSDLSNQTLIQRQLDPYLYSASLVETLNRNSLVKAIKDNNIKVSQGVNKIVSLLNKKCDFKKIFNNKEYVATRKDGSIDFKLSALADIFIITKRRNDIEKISKKSDQVAPKDQIIDKNKNIIASLRNYKDRLNYAIDSDQFGKYSVGWFFNLQVFKKYIAELKTAPDVQRALSKSTLDLKNESFDNPLCSSLYGSTLSSEQNSNTDPKQCNLESLNRHIESIYENKLGFLVNYKNSKKTIQVINFNQVADSSLVPGSRIVSQVSEAVAKELPKSITQNAASKAKNVKQDKKVKTIGYLASLTQDQNFVTAGSDLLEYNTNKYYTQMHVAYKDEIINTNSSVTNGNQPKAFVIVKGKKNSKPVTLEVEIPITYYESDQKYHFIVDGKNFSTTYIKLPDGLKIAKHTSTVKIIRGGAESYFESVMPICGVVDAGYELTAGYTTQAFEDKLNQMIDSRIEQLEIAKHANSPALSINELKKIIRKLKIEIEELKQEKQRSESLSLDEKIASMGKIITNNLNTRIESCKKLANLIHVGDPVKDLYLVGAMWAKVFESNNTLSSKDQMTLIFVKKENFNHIFLSDVVDVAKTFYQTNGIKYETLGVRNIEGERTDEKSMIPPVSPEKAPLPVKVGYQIVTFNKELWKENEVNARIRNVNNVRVEGATLINIGGKNNIGARIYPLHTQLDKYYIETEFSDTGLPVCEDIQNGKESLGYPLFRLAFRVPFETELTKFSSLVNKTSPIIPRFIDRAFWSATVINPDRAYMYDKGSMNYDAILYGGSVIHNAAGVQIRCVSQTEF